MKINKKKITVIVLLILMIAIGLAIVVVDKNKSLQNDKETLIESITDKNIIDENTTIVINSEASVIDKNTVEYNEDSNVNELKKIVGAEGESNIYEVQTEFEGKKILAVKKSIRFKTAFAGMIKKDLPQQAELDDIYNKNYPNKKGIWVEENSRNKVLELLNNGNSNKYDINNEGYLQIKNKTSQKEADKKIDKAINGNKTIILGVSSVCYIVDDMTGNIESYNFEENDTTQTHEYFEDDNSLIIFITENKENELNKSKILNNIVQLF